ncbi:hypothetical protein LEMLEM_LOCUS11014, partial [Lemmus lemmus]
IALYICSHLGPVLENQGLGRKVGSGWAPKDRVFQDNRNTHTMEHKASMLDVKSLPNWAQEAEERSLQRQGNKERGESTAQAPSSRAHFRHRQG